MILDEIDYRSTGEGVAEVVLNRPETLNAISGRSGGMRDQLIHAIGLAEDDPDIGCVVLRGAGRAFSGGGDIAGNGLSGVTMHAHIINKNQFEDLNGNVIVANAIGKNNVDGDPLDGPPGPSDPHTTGVLVYSGGTRVHVNISLNHISNNFYGIWLSKAVTATGLGTNVFNNVNIHISAGH